MKLPATEPITATKRATSTFVGHLRREETTSSINAAGHRQPRAIEERGDEQPCRSPGDQRAEEALHLAEQLTEPSFVKDQ